MQDPEHPESSIPMSHLQDEVSLVHVIDSAYGIWNKESWTGSPLDVWREQRRNDKLTLSSLIFREFTGNLVKFGAIAELLEGFFFLGVFLALDIVSVSLYVAAFFCFGVYGSQML